jgi:hypothetical protein
MCRRSAFSIPMAISSAACVRMAAKPFTPWPCYHTQLDVFELGGQTVGIVGCAVGAVRRASVPVLTFASLCSTLVCER